MNDDFLHRLRAQPRPEFLARLKTKLDGQPLHSRPRPIRSLVAGLLVGASALAIASLALRGELAGFHWGGWGRGTVGSDEVSARAGEDAASGQVPRSVNGGWPQNPWAVAQPSTAGKTRKREAAGGAAVVPIPQSGTSAPSSAPAQYSGGAALIVSTYAEQLRITATRDTRELTDLTAQEMVKNGFKQPRVSTTSAAELFADLCSGNSADFAFAARRMTAAESEACARAGNANPVEVRLGAEAVVLVRSKLYGPLPVSARDVYLALSRTAPDPANLTVLAANRRATWNDVNPALPPDYIQVFGPLLTSRQGQVFLSLVMEAGCDTFASIAALQKPADREAACRAVREDAYTEVNVAGYPKFVQRLLMYPNAIGIFGYPFYMQSGDALVVSAMGGVLPTPQSIADGSYPGARNFYLYVNRFRFSRMGSMRSLLLMALGPYSSKPEGFIRLSRAESEATRDRALAALSSQP
jgi:phosphate transport system substrate-binding protein